LTIGTVVSCDFHPPSFLNALEIERFLGNFHGSPELGVYCDFVK
jgi:hypothetical protein